MSGPAAMSSRTMRHRSLRGSKMEHDDNLSTTLLRATYLSVEEHRALLSTAGYSDVTIFEERGKGWLCGVGTKPIQPSLVEGDGLAPSDRRAWRNQCHTHNRQRP